jgi:anti-sigma factor RsiW
MTMTCDRAREELPALVLGALPAAEAEPVLAHVRGCAECAQALQALLPLRDALNSAVPATELPAGFTARLMEKTGPVRPGSARRGRPVVARLGWALAAAAALLLALLGANLGQVNGELLRQRQDAARIAALLSRPDVVAVAMRGYSRGARGRLYVSRRWDEGVLMLGHLPALPAGTVYQLWLVGRAGVQSVATEPAVAGGALRLYLHPPHGLGSYAVIALTIEPAGGSRAPRGQRVLAGRLR